jgi:hypothetical protein
MTMDDKHELRFRFLQALYEGTEGRTSSQLPMWQLGESLGMEREQVSDIVEYLANQGLVQRRSFGGVIAISHAGVVEIEQALSDPETPTEHFPPIINITTVGTMIGSQIQQGSHGSRQSQSQFQVDIGKLQAFTRHFRENLPRLELSARDKAESEADLATLEAQAVSGRPKISIVRESLQSLRNILEGAAGSVVASDLLPKLLPLLAALGGH